MANGEESWEGTNYFRGKGYKGKINARKKRCKGEKLLGGNGGRDTDERNTGNKGTE